VNLIAVVIVWFGNILNKLRKQKFKHLIKEGIESLEK